MSNNVPGSRPQITRQQLVDKIAAAHPGYILPDFFTCGIRGYYKDSMGKPGQNDRMIYDDAMFVVGKNEFFAYNGNTDPSAFRLGIATLKPGIWHVYKFDLHRGKKLPPYLALCQRAGPVTVVRDGKGEDTGNFGVNQHRGGIWSTSSLACQTVPPSQYDGPDGYITKAQLIAEKYYGPDYKKLVYTYILLEN
jgi:lysozyme